MTSIDKKSLRHLAREAGEGCICQRTRKAARLVTKTYDDALRPFGLRGTQFTLLAAAAQADGGVSISELAEHLGMDRTTLSRNLKPLERDGMIDILDEENVGRTKTVRLTESGFAKFAEAAPSWRQTQKQMISLLAADQLSPLMNGLRSLSDELS
ncbi:MarR family transcriptional regulator [Sphingorhabdus sp. Alg231-15]|uniref:MarR family transcriptional regulator n=1 Tax=Sphingorhabdus sp. Alg231-15 TaxID=1922222 RepID=UPI000D55AB04